MSEQCDWKTWWFYPLYGGEQGMPDVIHAPNLDFAFKLHTDIGKNFVKAIDIRTKQAVGKDYKLQNGDGLEIMTK